MREFDFKSLCTPAKIYFILAILSAILMLLNRVHVMTVFMKLLFAFIWTIILGWLCKEGFKALSWFIVLLPFVIMLFANQRGDTFEMFRQNFQNIVEGEDGM